MILGDIAGGFLIKYFGELRVGFRVCRVGCLHFHYIRFLFGFDLIVCRSLYIGHRTTGLVLQGSYGYIGLLSKK